MVNTVLRAGSLAFLRLTGWRIEGALPVNARKCVLIAAPHTSNWDLPYALMVAFVLRLNIERKVSGLGPEFMPTDDVERDMAEIKRFYAGIKGRRPAQFESS